MDILKATALLCRFIEYQSKYKYVRIGWLKGLNLTEEDLPKDTWVCSRHFCDGDSKNIPSIHIGEKFAECALEDTSRGKRQATHNARKELHTKLPTPVRRPSSISPSPSETPNRSVCESSSTSLYQSDSSSVFSPGPLASTPLSPVTGLQVTVNVALVSQIEMLKQENRKLKAQLEDSKQAPFGIECIADNNSLISLYTGLPSYVVFLDFLELLCPAVNNLHYWGTKK